MYACNLGNLVFYIILTLLFVLEPIPIIVTANVSFNINTIVITVSWQV